MFEVLDTVCQPTRATKYSAMVDLYAREDIIIDAGETKIVPLGVKIDLTHIQIQMTKMCLVRLDEIPVEELTYNHYEYHEFMSSHYLELHPRSSLRAKGLIIGVGVIDLDYPDEIGLIVHNPIKKFDTLLKIFGLGFARNYTIKKGDKVAQCTLKEHKGFLLGIETETERAGGFGSSGK